VAFFKSEQEVYDTIGQLFVDLTEDADMYPQFQQADTIVRYELRDPEAQITVKMLTGQAGQVDLGPSELEPEVTMTMDADIAHSFWLGQVNVTIALARGQIRAHGPVAKILKLVPLTKPVFPRYEALLAQQGRADLVEAAQPA